MLEWAEMASIQGQDTTFGGYFGLVGSQWQHDWLGQKLLEELGGPMTMDLP